MKKSNKLLGTFLLVCLMISTVFWTCLIYLFALLKLLPFHAMKNFSRRCLNKIASYWTATNILFVRRFLDTKWQITMPDHFSVHDWHLIIANHQTWLDIVVIHHAFHNKIPFPKFFLKDQLKWVPFLGLAWWAMEFPFMKRHNKQQIAKNPGLRNTDLLETQKRCRSFIQRPTSLLNFVEGTRFTAAKHQQKKSPYNNLLPPKAGGLLFTLECMSNRFKHLTDVTISYPYGTKSLWQFLCNEVKLIRVDVKTIDLPAPTASKTAEDTQYNTHDFRQWLNQHWQQKDDLLDKLNTV